MKSRFPDGLRATRPMICAAAGRAPVDNNADRSGGRTRPMAGCQRNAGASCAESNRQRCEPISMSHGPRRRRYAAERQPTLRAVVEEAVPPSGRARNGAKLDLRLTPGVQAALFTHQLE